MTSLSATRTMASEQLLNRLLDCFEKKILPPLSHCVDLAAGADLSTQPAHSRLASPAIAPGHADGLGRNSYRLPGHTP
jgi:hypothetical protein